MFKTDANKFTVCAQFWDSTLNFKYKRQILRITPALCAYVWLHGMIVQRTYLEVLWILANTRHSSWLFLNHGRCWTPPMARFTRMSTFSKFWLNISRQHLTESTVNNVPSTLFWDLAQPGSSPTSAPSGSWRCYGCFLSDSEFGQYPLSWNSWEEFLSFLTREQAVNSIELQLVLEAVASTAGTSPPCCHGNSVCGFLHTWLNSQ